MEYAVAAGGADGLDFGKVGKTHKKRTISLFKKLGMGLNCVKR